MPSNATNLLVISRKTLRKQNSQSPVTANRNRRTQKTLILWPNFRNNSTGKKTLKSKTSTITQVRNQSPENQAKPKSHITNISCTTTWRVMKKYLEIKIINITRISLRGWESSHQLTYHLNWGIIDVNFLKS